MSARSTFLPRCKTSSSYVGAEGARWLERTPRIRARPRARLASHRRRDIEGRFGSAGCSRDYCRRRRRHRQSRRSRTDRIRTGGTHAAACRRSRLREAVAARHRASRDVAGTARPTIVATELADPRSDASDLQDVATRVGSSTARFCADERRREGAQPGRSDRRRMARTRSAVQRARRRACTRLRGRKSTRIRSRRLRAGACRCAQPEHFADRRRETRGPLGVQVRGS